MIKKITQLFIVLILFAGPSIAQDNTVLELEKPNKWRVSQVNYAIGINWDYYQSMSLDELLIHAENPDMLFRNVQNMTEESVVYTAGGALYGSLSLSPLNRSTGTYRDNQEWQIGVALHSPKEAMVSYKNEALDTSIVYCNIHSEMTLESAYVFKGQWGKRWHWYAGGGLNLAFTFDNEMILISGKYFKPGAHPSIQESEEINREHYKAKPVYYSRAYIPYGIHYRIGKNVLLGFDFRTGIGIQSIAAKDINYIRKTGAFSLGLKYRLGT